MSAQIIPVDPFALIIFGGTGDLAERKLLPALYYRQVDGQLSEPTSIIAASRSDMSDDEYRAFARKALEEHIKDGLDKDQLKLFLQRLSYVSVDAKSDRGWPDLAKALPDEGGRKRACYLAVGPSIFCDIATMLRDHDIITDETRIIVEKPIGRDLQSANALYDTLGQVFHEHQIFRIDHYLG